MSPAASLLLAAATYAPVISADAEVFASGAAGVAEGDAASAFGVPQAEVGLSGQWGLLGFRVKVDGGRDRGPAQGPLLLQLEEAYGGAVVPLGPGVLEVRGGLVPDPWQVNATERYGLRALDRLLVIRADLLAPSDFGATAAWTLPWLRVEGLVLNGEGLDATDRNAEKDAGGLLAVQPLTLPGGGLWIRAGYRHGSRGADATRAHRTTAAFDARFLGHGLGGELVYAQGIAGRRDDVGLGLGAWGRALAWDPWLGLVARYDRLAVEDEVGHRLSAGLYLDALGDEPSARIRLFVLYRGERGAGRGDLDEASLVLDLAGIWTSVDDGGS